jgi:hypothetical protein
MKRHATPLAGRLRRWLREFWPDDNPLRRRWDRAESLILGGLVTAFIIGGALAALVTGHLAYASAQHARQTEIATVHQVPAVLLTAASAAPAGLDATAKASWNAPGGARHTGQVYPPAGSPAGATVKVWVNAAGWQATPPLQPGQVQGQGVLASVLAVMALAAVLWAAGLAVHVAADRRRMAAWDSDWRATGPRWSRHG